MSTKRCTRLFLAILIGLFSIGVFSIAMISVSAEKRLIEADGYAIVGDDPEENPLVAQERARKDAKRAASEKAGVYVESVTEVRSGVVTKDVVRTVSANILDVSMLN